MLPTLWLILDVGDKDFEGCCVWLLGGVGFCYVGALDLGLCEQANLLSPCQSLFEY